jgi:hypothetical protein
MDMSPLQQQVWQMQIVVRATLLKAETAYLDAQRQHIRVRGQQERLHLRHAMPGAHARIIELTACLLVARHLDAAALPECEAKNGHPPTQARRARICKGPGKGGRS